MNQVQQESVKVTVADNRVGSNDALSGSFIVAIRALINHEQRKRSRKFETVFQKMYY